MVPVARGGSPVEELFGGVDRTRQGRSHCPDGASRKVGNQLRPPRSEPLGDGLFELRGHQVRIFYGFRPGRRIVLLDGMVKKRDKIPTRVLERVRGYQQEVRTKDAKAVRGP